ncbi:MAG: LysR substrate-binding domain-containing protein [Vicinamibacterales bacterium]|nr:LysR substrate-binding domain-containing protein [Vicinamibacterales bacterium]
MDRTAPLPCSLRQLQYLVAVADLGGFRKAADACHVSQPSLSAQIAQVEQALGVQIFERDRRRVRLSAAGAPIVDQARQVLLAMRDLTDIARRQGNPLGGTVRIGVIPTVCPYLLPDVTPALARDLPDLTIVWREEKTDGLIRAVTSGALDGAILALEGDLPGMAHEVIGLDRFVLAAAPGHPLVKSSRPATAETLEGARVLLLEDGHCFRDQALAVCARAGATEEGFRATSLSTLVQMVGRANGGVTLLPALAVPVENRRGQLAVRPFTRAGPSRTLAMIWRKGSAMATPLKAVAASVRRQVGRG